MSTLLGQTLSHYRVTRRIGAGGMGEVYRATDTSLGRDVAIKVLPPDFAGDAERLARFRREAHLLASLNHPNIAAIYGLEEAEGRPFLALELVEGEDLKQRLDRGAIPVEEALEIALQVAEALEEAHGKGIVHRDLKPANVKLATDGRVKVLDFGLAKAWAAENSAPGLFASAQSQSPTMARDGTMAGVVLGTAAYMSPEQARGKPVDKRADVWSFGVLLWEMLAGRALFAGDTVTDVIAAVMSREPDMNALPAATPAAVSWLIVRCLRKDLRQRLPDIGAARLDLQEVIAGPHDGPTSSASATQRAERLGRTRERAVWTVLVSTLAAVAVMSVLRRGPAPQPQPPTVAGHFVVDAPLVGEGAGARSAGIGPWDPPAVSPDGRSLVFSTARPKRLWIRSLDALESREIPGTEDASYPFWSPDGRSLAFGVRGEIRKLALSQGTVERVCTLPQPAFGGGTWNASGTILFQAGGNFGTLFTVPANGGNATPLTTYDQGRGERAHNFPQFLPDGRRFLFSVGSSRPENSGVFISSLDAPATRQRIADGLDRAEYVAHGYLLTSREALIVAQRFEPAWVVPAGDAAPIGSTSEGAASILFSAASNVLAWKDAPMPLAQLEWRGRDGRRLGVFGEARRYGQIALSPAGEKVAVEVGGAGGRSIWTLDVARGVARRVLPAWVLDPVWSPDGQELAYTCIPGAICRQRLDGAPAPRTPTVAADALWSYPEAWIAPNTLLFVTMNRSGRTIWAQAMAGDAPPEKLVESPFALDEPQVSPDGRWLAYQSNETDRFEVYLEPFRRPGEKIRVSIEGGMQPRWRGDGRELFFLSETGDLMVADVRGGTAAPVFAVRVLIEAALDLPVQDAQLDAYAVTPDGQRFLFKKTAGRPQPPQIHVLINWLAMLQLRDAPTGSGG